jgi:mRNA-degrading endonuclease toxin of MazEF toxin-antitoxin module
MGVAVAGPSVSRGQVYLVRLDPTLGSEIKKTRPCVVVVALDQLRTVDVERLVKSLGQLDGATVIAVLERLQDTFAE